MADYVKTEWVDGENKYSITDQLGNVIPGFEDVKLVYTGIGGTPLSPTNMGKIEQELFELDEATVGFLFGNGSDGDVTIAANISLSRNMYYKNLTINSGVTLDTQSWLVFVKGTLLNNGIITNTSILNNSGITSTGAGGNPANHSNTANGIAGASITLSAGGAGGKGGNADGYTGGAGGAKSSSYDTVQLKDWLKFLLLNGITINGGAGGGGGARGNYGYAGVGGRGGGLVYIRARKLINNGTLRAKGSDGANARADDPPNDVLAYQAVGGGGGGGGGVIIVVHSSTNTVIGTTDVAGGAPGANLIGGTHTGVNAVAGSPGSVIAVKV